VLSILVWVVAPLAVAAPRGKIGRAQASGEFRKDIDPEVLIDLIYGPTYYRLLVRHQKLDKCFSKELIDHIIVYVKS
jgi:hypothetical protein